MGQFKPMVKMYTNEPSVILKLKKGGKVEKKADGGYMPMASTMPGMPARGGAAPAASPMRPSLAMRRRAMNPNLMKKGGATGAEIDKAETRTTIEKGAKKFDKTKMDTAHKDRAHGTGEVKEGKPGGYKMGGTIEGNEGKFANTKVNDGDKTDKAHGTGGVRMSNAGGYKKGGKAVKKATGGAIPAATGKNTKEDHLKNGTYQGGNWENRAANSAKPGVKGTKTGEVKEANAGGYKMGGAAKKAYATGGQVVDDGKAVKMPRHFVSQPVANSLQSGTFKKGGKVEKEEKPNLRLLKTHTGPKGHVAKVYKDRDWGEHRVKFYSPEGKHFSEADYHTDDVGDAHDTAKGQLNRYKKGGKARFAEGGSEDLSKGAYGRHYENEKKENEAMRESILGAPKRAYEAVKNMFSSPSTPPQGSVTKTEKSVTVTPRKRGGSMKR